MTIETAPAPPRAAHRRRRPTGAGRAHRRPGGGDRRGGGAAAPHLLHGVTGSGKTEVYLRAAAAALERGEGVIVLVPEIALTPQTVGRFQARFGDTVALLHSALGEGERYDEWRRLRTGEARIAVGPRSAVFAPVADLGLVVVDEEHDASYKHEGDPRYDARTVAAERARRAGARLLVGTATPAPRDLARRCRAFGSPTASTIGRCRPCACSTCAARGTRCTPRRGARWRARARRSCCSTAAAGRTSSPAGRAGRTWECPQLRRRARAAPRRGRDRLPPLRPPRARARALRRLRLARRSPATARAPSGSSTSCARGSTCRSSGSTPTPQGPRTPCRSCSRASAPRPSGLLLGTQMVAKGHDFPDVTLGVVLDADSTLRFPDFRAEERTFALIAQLAGRAGRGRARRAGARADERARRGGDRGGRAARRGRLPGRRARAPAGARLPAVRGPHPDRLLRRGGRRRRGLRRAPSRRPSTARRATEVLGPAPLFRLRGRERFQVVVKTARARRGGARDGRGRRRCRTRSRPPRGELQRRRRPAINCRVHGTRGSDPAAAGAPRRPSSSATGSIPRRGPAATPRSSSSASTATRCCAAARSRSSASTRASPRRSAGWAA